MSFGTTLVKMISILFVMAGGYLANRMGILGGETDKKISKLLLTITVPGLVLGAVAGGTELPEANVVGTILLAALIFYLVSFAMVLIVPKILGGEPRQKGVYRYAMIVPNTAYIGYPVITALLGAKGLLYAVLFCMPANILQYTLGPLMVAGIVKFDFKKLLTPATISSVLALVIVLLRIQFPTVVVDSLTLLGSCTVPLSLLVIGSLLAGIKPGKVLTMPRLWGLAAFRLIIMPIVYFFVLKPLHLEELVFQVAVIEMCMPIALNGSLMCLEYGGDGEFMASGIFVTTVASLLTIPIVTTILL